MKRDGKTTVVGVFSTFVLSYTKIVAVFIATIEPDFILSNHNYLTRKVLHVDL